MGQNGKSCIWPTQNTSVLCTSVYSPLPRVSQESQNVANRADQNFKGVLYLGDALSKAILQSCL